MLSKALRILNAFFLFGVFGILSWILSFYGMVAICNSIAILKESNYLNVIPSIALLFAVVVSAKATRFVDQKIVLSKGHAIRKYVTVIFVSILFFICLLIGVLLLENQFSK